MSYTGDELQAGLDGLASAIVVLLRNYEHETGYPVESLPIFRDSAGNLSCQPHIILSGSATILKKGAMDS